MNEISRQKRDKRATTKRQNIFPAACTLPPRMSSAPSPKRAMNTEGVSGSKTKVKRAAAAMAGKENSMPEAKMRYVEEPSSAAALMAELAKPVVERTG